MDDLAGKHQKQFHKYFKYTNMLPMQACIYRIGKILEVHKFHEKLEVGFSCLFVCDKNKISDFHVHYPHHSRLYFVEKVTSHSY